MVHRNNLRRPRPLASVPTRHLFQTWQDSPVRPGPASELYRELLARAFLGPGGTSRETAADTLPRLPHVAAA